MRKANSGIGGGVNRSGIGRGIGAGTSQMKKDMPLYKNKSEFEGTASA